jgi:chorismate mutase
MLVEHHLRNILIVGPCAAESRQQVIETAKRLKERDVHIMRASHRKPRTRPGFEGVGEEGIPWLAEVTKLGITVATEVLLPDHVSEVVKGISAEGNPANILLWLGSRNQNHFLQQEIAKTMLGETDDSVKLMIKNQPWRDESHWLGIVDHVTDAGFPPERIILCHRGFAPGNENNPQRLRNLPDWNMAMRVKRITGLPMIIDPSHIGGSVENVFKVVEEAKKFPFDGLMIEVHPAPTTAKTDVRQQLNISELDQLLKTLKPFQHY